MTTNTTPRRSIKSRIKHRTPEILIGASAIAGLVGYVYIRNTLDLKSVATAFAAHAADPSVEIIAGGEEAFVVLSAEALATLEKFGTLDIADMDAVKYVLSLVNTAP